MARPKAVFIGTGGTISSRGRDSLDILDYTATDERLDASAILDAIPELRAVAEVIPVCFRAVPSPAIGFAEWRDLVRLCEDLAAEHPDLAGIVIGHGTATLEETAYALSLDPHGGDPGGAGGLAAADQRPFQRRGPQPRRGGQDRGGAESRGRGVLVVLNDEIQAAREVTKTSGGTPPDLPDARFRGARPGRRGAVRYYRRPERAHAPGTPFEIRSLGAPPRVDVCLRLRGCRRHGGQGLPGGGRAGLVSAGLAPGMTPPGEADALAEAAAPASSW